MSRTRAVAVQVNRAFVEASYGVISTPAGC